MENNKIAYAQVLEVLKNMDNYYVDKIPKSLKKFFDKNRPKDYEFNLDMNKELKDNNLDKETLNILAMLNLNYWCSDEDKNKLINKYAENDKKHQEELRKKYNPDDLFKNTSNNLTNSVQPTTEFRVVKYEPEKWYKKLFRKILSFFVKR